MFHSLRFPVELRDLLIGLIALVLAVTLVTVFMVPAVV